MPVMKAREPGKKILTKAMTFLLDGLVLADRCTWLFISVMFLKLMGLNLEAFLRVAVWKSRISRATLRSGPGCLS